MDHYLGGYYLVEGLPRPSQLSDFLPPMLWTTSSCFCTIYPDTWSLSWVNAAPEELDAMCMRLELDAAGFRTLQVQVDGAFEAERFGWPNVWLERASAEEFYRQYLAAVPHVRLLAVALPASYLDGFLQHHAPAPGFGACGLYQLLSRRIKLEGTARLLGYEILGVEEGGSCHSFLCNYLEVAYRQKLQIPFNDHGLIDDYADAVHAADYTNHPSTGSEPVPWYPWLIVEYVLPPNDER
jgi:hypothetical protein